jgi:DNA-binding CsgD family transcriptional regulator
VPELLRRGGEGRIEPDPEAGRIGVHQRSFELTAQERQIAQLAAEGLSNREIGQKLFVSPRTVSTHLYRVYPKLGISARSQLVAALSVTP